MVGDVGLAKEFAQDAPVTALSRCPEFGRPRLPGTGLMTLARGSAIDRWRRRERLARRPDQWRRDAAGAQARPLRGAPWQLPAVPLASARERTFTRDGAPATGGGSLPTRG